MWKDPIIEDLHAQREAHAAQHGFDAHKIYEELKQQQALALGRKTVTLVPRRPANTEAEPLAI